MQRNFLVASGTTHSILKTIKRMNDEIITAPIKLAAWGQEEEETADSFSFCFSFSFFQLFSQSWKAW